MRGAAQGELKMQHRKQPQKQVDILVITHPLYEKVCFAMALELELSGWAPADADPPPIAPEMPLLPIDPANRGLNGGDSVESAAAGLRRVAIETTK